MFAQKSQDNYSFWIIFGVLQRVWHNTSFQLLISVDWVERQQFEKYFLFAASVLFVSFIATDHKRWLCAFIMNALHVRLNIFNWRFVSLIKTRSFKGWKVWETIWKMKHIERKKCMQNYFIFVPYSTLFHKFWIAFRCFEILLSKTKRSKFCSSVSQYYLLKRSFSVFLPIDLLLYLFVFFQLQAISWPDWTLSERRRTVCGEVENPAKCFVCIWGFTWSPSAVLIGASAISCIVNIFASQCIKPVSAHWFN